MTMLTVRLPASQVKQLKLVSAMHDKAIQAIVSDALADHLPRLAGGDKESRALLKDLLARRASKEGE
jgi:hypothetical protein